MKTKKSFLKVISKSDFKKYVNYHLNGRGKVVHIGTFSKDTIIFNILTNKGNSCFSPGSHFNFMDAYLVNGQIKSTFWIEVENLKHVVNEIDFFNRFESDRVKMGFPVIVLKQNYKDYI